MNTAATGACSLVSNPDLIPHTTLSQERFYLQASYRFSDLFEAATYYSVQYDPENRNSRGFVNGAQSEYGPNDNIGLNSYSGWTKDLAVSLRFDINYNWLVKLEGHVVDGTAVLYRIDNKDKEQWRDSGPSSGSKQRSPSEQWEEWR